MIVDASVAMKWVVAEADSEAAIDLLDNDILAAPDLIFCEIANGIWKKWRRGELAAVPAGLRTVTEALSWVEPSVTLLPRATELAIELSHPAYDCFYLALAEARDDVLVTADRRFAMACANTNHEPRIQLFGAQ